MTENFEQSDERDSTNPLDYLGWNVRMISMKRRKYWKIVRDSPSSTERADAADMVEILSIALGLRRWREAQAVEIAAEEQANAKFAQRRVDFWNRG
ncbi:MAG: hypothetical protein GXP05_04300 [Alphaproteobacteria bacterium]|nr:hypothetical protein [Alphaproteobacteria bacterium]